MCAHLLFLIFIEVANLALTKVNSLDVVIFIAFGFNLPARIFFEILSRNFRIGIETQCKNIETNRICIYAFHVKPKPFSAWKLKAMQACNWKRQKPKRFAGGCLLCLFVVSCPKCMVSWLVL